jgi:PAS domain S-box-containing protein
MMNLEEFSRQLESMQARILRLSPVNGGNEPSDLRLLWEETSEALGVTMEEMRVAEEELRRQSDELQDSRQAVEAERQRYRDLFEFAPDGYLVTDLVGLIKEANRAASELLGVSPRYLAGKPLASYVAMDDRPGFRVGMHRLQQVGRREGWVIRMQPRQGSAYDASVTVAVVRDWNGTPTGLRWLIREGIDRQAKSPGGRRSRSSRRVTIGLLSSPPRLADLEERWTRAKHENEALRGLLYGLDLIVWEADVETGRYWFISPRAEELLGYPAESWLERQEFWAEIIHTDDRPLVQSQRARFLREGRGGEMEYRVIAADGRAIWLRESLTIADEGEGRPRVLRGCLWDISRRKKVERQLYTDRRKLAEHLSDVWHLYLLGGQFLAAFELGPVLEEILSALAALQGAEMAVLCLLDADRD